MITATELLEFLCKAQKLFPSSASFRQMDGGYRITLCLDWHDNNDWYNQNVLISNEGESSWHDAEYDFDTMNNILDEMLEKQKQKEIKEQKRKELLARLTDEERELLGV